MIHCFRVRIVPQLHVLTHNLKPIVRMTMRETLKYERVDKPCEIQMTLVTENMIARLNRIHRRIAKVTDVLSFPLTEQIPGKKLKVSETDLSDKGRVCLGDIVLCLPQASRQSQEYGHSLEREIAYLTVHSVLHLLGYDHMQEDDKKLMRKHEEAVMAKVGVSI